MSACKEKYQQLGQNVSNHDKCQSLIIARKITTIQPTFTKRTSGPRLENSPAVNFVVPCNKRSASYFNPPLLFILLLLSFSLFRTIALNTINLSLQSPMYIEVGVPELFC